MTHWREFLDSSAPSGGYLSWKEVARRTSLSRTTAWRLQRRDEFPRAYPISPGRVGHLECEVEAWIAARARPGECPSPSTPRTRVATSAAAPAQKTAALAANARTPPTEEAVLRMASPEAVPPPRKRSRRTARPRAAASQQITFNF